MNTAVISKPSRVTMRQLQEAEAAAFSRIPGMGELLNATQETISDLEARFPDAAFARMISENLFTGDWEQNEIHQQAYFSILNGESISQARFRYDRDMEDYLKRHMWD